MSWMNHVRVVLVRAENPMNIGHVARALRNFGVSHLFLVQCAPHQTDEAYTTGFKAKRILNSAKTFDSLKEALSGSTLSVGFSARIRNDRGSPVGLLQLVPKIVETVSDHKVSLVFGNEKNGLSNEELALCDVASIIPASSVYPTLNLSHAVAVALFEIFSRTEESFQFAKNRKQYFASIAEFEALMKKIHETLVLLNYRASSKVDMLGKVHGQIRNFFQKSTLELRELKLFNTFLHKIQDRIKKDAST